MYCIFRYVKTRLALGRSLLFYVCVCVCWCTCESQYWTIVHVKWEVIKSRVVTVHAVKAYDGKSGVASSLLYFQTGWL
jgi:hypothetical protein